MVAAINSAVDEPLKGIIGNMKLIKALLASLAAIVIASGFALSAQADLITGMLNIAGTATYDHPIGSATMITAFDNVTTQGANTGDFASIPKNIAVAMTAPYVFNPSTPSPMLWSVAGFTFDLQTTTIITQSANGILITGEGIITGNGFDPTPGEWSFSQQKGRGPHARACQAGFDASVASTANYYVIDFVQILHQNICFYIKLFSDAK